jgi:hypothetical protein
MRSAVPAAGEPFALLIGGDQARLRLEPGNIGWIIRLPEPINERAGTRKLCLTVDQDQGCIHHMVSASISSYSEWIPKNRIATTCAEYCRRAISR